MRTSSSAIVLLCAAAVAQVAAVGDLSKRKLTGRQAAVALYKRQDAFCLPGYFQCPVMFGGGCCMNGQTCATTNCPALEPIPNYVPNAVITPSGALVPTPSPAATNPPVSVQSAAPPTSQVPVTTAVPSPTNTPTPSAPSSSSPPSSLTSAPSTSAPSTSAPSTAAPSTSPPSASPSPTSAATTDPFSSRANMPSSTDSSSTSTATLTPAQISEAALIASGQVYIPHGITTGGKVGIAFAAITGALIVGLVLWRAIIGLKNPKPKRRKPVPAPRSGAASGPPSRGLMGFLPFGKKKPGSGDRQPMMETAAAPGTRGVSIDAPVPPQAPGPHGSGSSLLSYSASEQDGYNPNAGGDLGYRDFDENEMEGLFPHMERDGQGRPGGRGGQGYGDGPGFPQR